MSSVRLGDAMAALTAAFQASPALAGVIITEGDAPSVAGEPGFIVVGHDGSFEADGSLAEVTESGTFSTAFDTMGGPPPQEETGSINVVAVSQTGDSADLPGRIAEAQRLAAACNDACTDLRSGTIVFDSPTGGRLYARQVAPGCAAVMSFAVSYSAPW